MEEEEVYKFCLVCGKKTKTLALLGKMSQK